MPIIGTLIWNYSILLAGSILTLALYSPATAQLWRGDNSHVEARLISDAAAVTPGQRFRVGVLFTIEPAWHIYWINPGDAGMPTTVELQAPNGAKVSDLHWPTPHRFLDPGDIVSNGYEKQVLLWWHITAPDSASIEADKVLTFAAKANWLACRQACVLGSADLALTVPMGQALPSPEASLFDQTQAKTPVAADDDQAPATVDTQTKNGQTQVTVSWKQAVTDVEVFAGVGANVAIDALTIEEGQSPEKPTVIHFTPRLLGDPAAGVKNVQFPLVIAYRPADSADAAGKPDAANNELKAHELKAEARRSLAVTINVQSQDSKPLETETR